jgi:carbon storage regulator
MLYLVRKLEESIIINNDIEVRIVDIKRNKVRLGIKFAKSSNVLRKEVFDRIAKENLTALNAVFDKECNDQNE